MEVEGDLTLIRGTLERALALGIEGKIVVVTHEDHVPVTREECRKLDKKSLEKIVVLAEPIARNTAPALALAASWLSLQGADRDVLLVLAADHLISPIETFAKTVEVAAREGRAGYIVPFGLTPEYPATGYGYIEAGEKAGGGREIKVFREKPDQKTAEQYAGSGRHFWNSGMFVYGVDVFLEELTDHEPAVASAFEGPIEGWFRPVDDEEPRTYLPSDALRERYRGCPAISVDYAVMERSRRIRMVEAEFSWNDVGSWDVIADIAPTSRTPVYEKESRGNFVYSDIPVALCGVEDLIVAVSNGRVLVCKKGASQLVKEVAEEDLARS
jgi:mannose-1-phosphate guanylyltransferase/mannose-6-phosphate isomerase